MHQQHVVDLASAGQKLNIRWLVDWRQGDPPLAKSVIASRRYRVMMPANALLARGHQLSFVTLQDLRNGTAIDWRGVDVVVVGKLLPGANAAEFVSDSTLVLRACDGARNAGVTVVADVNDDHFDSPDVGAHWKSVVTMADLCAVGSAAMAQTVARHSSKPSVVVGDPIGSTKGLARVYADRHSGFAARLFRSNPLRLVWFGTLNNVPAMGEWAMFLAAAWREMPLALTLVTRSHPSVDALCRDFNERAGKHGQMTAVPWSEEAQWAAVEASDVVMLPSDRADPRKSVKTANRLVDALYAGRFVVASPVPSYLPYAEYVEITDNPVQSLHTYIDSPDSARTRISQGQIAVERDWSLDSIADQWLSVFGRKVPAHGTLSPVDEKASQPLVRLNLGCGDKILDGYVNVDVVEARAGKRPDVICDLRALTAFDDDTADEVMAIHVVEHFWRWEVEAVLSEWIRVLKPGGQLVLECPNLAAACAQFLKNPEAQSGPGPEGQMSMWVFYGDPAWHDPLMVHRWGYTPHSLSRMLESLGLVDVHQAAAQYKKREPRDMRIVGSKPGR